MNKVILMGRLTRDPEVRYSQGERSMAIARYWLQTEEDEEMLLAIIRSRQQTSLTALHLTGQENLPRSISDRE